MTQNDIAYYNARKEAKDNRLRRRETKRHNLVSEAAEQVASAARMKGAEASMVSAAAAQQNAKTNQAKYELEWEKEYGWDYGSEPSGHYQYDVDTGEIFYWSDNPSNERMDAYRQWEKDREDDIIITLPDNPKGVPQSYMEKELGIAKERADITYTKNAANKTFWDTLKSGASTVQIVVDSVDKAKEVLK